MSPATVSPQEHIAAPIDVVASAIPIVPGAEFAMMAPSATVAGVAVGPMSGPIAGAAPSQSLYVGELNIDVTEANLYDIFSTVGPVASIRVCRDVVLRRSLGYAYVNFHNPEDAERALEAFNYSPIKGRPCRIMWSQRDPSLRKSGLGNIFIKNLDKSIDNKALHDTFSAFGNILSCKVVGDDGSNLRGYGFVHFDSAEAAERAIEKVNGMLLNDKKVYVAHHVPRREREAKVEELRSRFTNVYVKHLDESVSADDLQQLFSPYGTITSAAIVYDQDGKSRGFGFVNFDVTEAAQRAVNELNGIDFHSKKLFVSRAQKKGEREDELRRKFEHARQERLSKYTGVNLYVKNLDDDINDERLRQEFAAYGTITSAKVMLDEKENSKGFGFVCFTNADEATKAVTEMNGRIVGTKPLYVAIAQRKDVRRAQLEMQHAQRAQMRMQQQMPGGMMYSSSVFYPQPMHAGQNGPRMYPPMPRPNRWNNGPLPVQGQMPMMPQMQMQMPPMATAAQMQMQQPMQQPMPMPPMQQMQQFNRNFPVMAPPQNQFGGANGVPAPQQNGQPQGAQPQGSSSQQQVQQQHMTRPPRQGGARPPRGMVGVAPGAPAPSGAIPQQAGLAGIPGMRPPPMANGPVGPNGVPIAPRRFKYSNNVRNVGMPPASPGVAGHLVDPMLLVNNPEAAAAQAAAQAQAGVVADVLNAAQLATMPSDMQKRTLGDYLYPMVHALEPERAGKLVGMLLELENAELLMLIESRDALASKVAEAVDVLNKSSVDSA